ncbi:transcriptional regulator, LysR family [Cribrihabitans marinus]|uniref:Transcriptional regulator, LysR family n=1 Tax=Cribrihabitans marinus TaxID=1227549 RepID=A0A1H6QFN6_9RHOB|nr:LysR family transcriptional regulator [Cribrihabitans marinus]GGH18008.1 LysR family transcriptional regulator [Cribrihabitans marinus]SEI39067.1 transcriptional regulator, LysR family [Cribrihabitans marinus]
MNPNRRLLPSLAALRALEALDRLGSASAVAEELSLTQSAVSRQLQALEAQMGVGLIQRDRKRLALTPSARDYLAEVRPALNRIAQASLSLQVKPAGGTLNLAILPAFGMRWLMPRLPDFARLHPDVTINMTTQLRPFSFAREPFDAALHFGKTDWPGTDALLLRGERVEAVGAPGMLPQGGLPQARDLLRRPLLHIQTRPDAWQDWFTAHGVTLQGPLPGTIHDQFSTIIQAALHGLGLALLPEYLAEQDLATGRLRRAHGGPIEARGAYYLVWPHEKARDPALTTFRHWLAGKAEPEDGLPR